MFHFCTITTYDHLYKCRALLDSLLAKQRDVTLHILCIDQIVLERFNHIQFFSLGDILLTDTAKKIASLYEADKDKLRWSMKPIFLSKLIDSGIDNLIYLDNDLYFYGDYSFLFDHLAEHSILLTPHHYPRDPIKNQNWLEANYRVGLYNAGFVAVNKNAQPHLIWWAECCAYRCEKNALRGLFDDQKYLDLMPIVAEDTLVLKHKGCNVAEWNKAVIKRSKAANEQILLDDKYLLIFIHYNHTTIAAIQNGEEPILKDAWIRYFDNLKKYKPELTMTSMIKKPSLIHKMKYYIWKLATEFNI